MATNIGTELRRLLKKLGGTPSKYDQTNELLHKITDQVNSGGSGGGGLVVTISTTDYTNWTIDKTLVEVTSAIQSGVPIIVRFNEEGLMSEGYLDSWDDSVVTFKRTTIWINDAEMKHEAWNYTSGGVSYTSGLFSLTAK